MVISGYSSRCSWETGYTDSHHGVTPTRRTNGVAAHRDQRIIDVPHPQVCGALPSKSSAASYSSLVALHASINPAPGNRALHMSVLWGRGKELRPSVAKGADHTMQHTSVQVQEHRRTDGSSTSTPP